ncbi:galactose oxidase [Prochlorococcus sp. AH-716-K03]|nr:galactose oxidase [Prochlorococcus sp. AH-716-K03]
MTKKIASDPSFSKGHNKLQGEWEYIEDPTYSRSIGSHVCMTCSRFDYSSQASCGSILCCNWHQKLIFQGQHLTHSCELYQRQNNFSIHKKLCYTSQAA